MADLSKYAHIKPTGTLKPHIAKRNIIWHPFPIYDSETGRLLGHEYIRYVTNICTDRTCEVEISDPISEKEYFVRKLKGEL